MISTLILWLVVNAWIEGISAHGKIFFFTADGEDYMGFANDDSIPSPGWTNTNYANFIGLVESVFPTPWSLQSSDAICGTDASPGIISANVSAGGYIEFDFTPWPGNHFGPILTYMANCHGRCETVDKMMLEWFKIAEMGLVDKELTGITWVSGTWAAPNILNFNAGPKGSAWRVVIPSNIAPGNYVVRIETIALHYALQGEIQYYPFCFNFVVSGNGTANPKGLRHEDLYHETDPAFSYDVWADPLADFEIPGPPIWTDLD